jgi:hypothetical protein
MMEQEEATNTYIFNRESLMEMARLVNQDRVVIQAMGGALSGIAEDGEPKKQTGQVHS